jgi:hypothetical protein
MTETTAKPRSAKLSACHKAHSKRNPTVYPSNPQTERKASFVILWKSGYTIGC